MRKRRRKIRHIAAKIYAVDACMLALIISTTGLINQSTAQRARQIGDRNYAIVSAREASN